jgi:hypothetical protein
MGFDLRFLTEDHRSIDPRELLLWSKQNQRLRTESHPSGLRLLYENPETDVQFSVEYLPDDQVGDEVEPPEGYFDTGIGFSLYYGRPSYFAYEAMPFLIDMARTFGLMIFNPQGPDATAITAKANELIVSWNRCNRQAVRAMAAENMIDSFFHLPKEKADLLWAYRLSKARREAQFGGDVYFPRIFLFARKGDRECATAVTWNGGAMAFPRVDYVILVRRKKPLFGVGEDSESIEYVAASKVFELVGDALEPFEDGEDLKLLMPKQAKRHGAQIARMASEPLATAFTRVPYDAFIDVDFLSQDAAA